MAEYRDKEREREVVDQLVDVLRENPEEFRSLREQFRTIDARATDEKAGLLLNFATSHEGLQKLVPAEPGTAAGPTVTTVTVTTVTWPSTAE